jgi:hypothetical protein
MLLFHGQLREFAARYQAAFDPAVRQRLDTLKRSGPEC